MNRADFYILQENSVQERFACILANKAWESGNNVYIYTECKDAAIIIDNLLWTYNDISFLPHGLCDEGNRGSIPVLIGWNDCLPDNCQVMINLTNDIPVAADQFARIIEIVTCNDEHRQLSRNRYRIYRDRGYELYNHTLEHSYDSI
jgi:DNA polymerase III subunit chi